MSSHTVICRLTGFLFLVRSPYRRVADKVAPDGLYPVPASSVVSALPPPLFFSLWLSFGKTNQVDGSGEDIPSWASCGRLSPGATSRPVATTLKAAVSGGNHGQTPHDSEWTPRGGAALGGVTASQPGPDFRAPLRTTAHDLPRDLTLPPNAVRLPRHPETSRASAKGSHWCLRSH